MSGEARVGAAGGVLTDSVTKTSDLRRGATEAILDAT